jgi:hypothetical protein
MISFNSKKNGLSVYFNNQFVWRIRDPKTHGRFYDSDIQTLFYFLTCKYGKFEIPKEQAKKVLASALNINVNILAVD